MNKKQNNVFITDYINNPRIEKEILGDHLCSRPSKEIEYLLVWHTKINKEFLNSFPNLKGIVRYGVGYDNIDLEICKERNIVFCNTPDYGTEEVSNTTISMIMDSSRKVFEYNQIAKKINDNSWQENTIKSLRRPSDLSLSIFGYGRIGQKVAFLSKNIFRQINIYDPYLKPGIEKVMGVKLFDDIDLFLKNSNILSIHCPLTQETKGLVNKNFLKKLPRGSILVNTARGQIIDNVDDLLEMINSQHLSGIGLDVLPDEPPTMNNFYKKYLDKTLDKNIIINPHTSYYSIESFEEMRVKAITNCIRFISGSKPLNTISLV